MFGGITVCRFWRRVFFANCVNDILWCWKKWLNLKGCLVSCVTYLWHVGPGTCLEVWEVEFSLRRDLKLNQPFNVRKGVKRDVRCIHASKRGANLGGAVFLVPCQPWTNDIMWYPYARKARRFRFSCKRFPPCPCLMGKFTNCTRIDFSNHATVTPFKKKETHKFKWYSSSQQENSWSLNWEWWRYLKGQWSDDNISKPKQSWRFWT